MASYQEIKTDGPGQEPSMFLQRPTAGRSQDIRHILARTFRDLYTRDPISQETVRNLEISKAHSDDPYHAKYVDNLKEAYDEWQRRMDEAAMLERHIMQAQARAMTADEKELNRAALSCEGYSQLGLPPVNAHFNSCIDSELLRKHNLLTPSDYLVPESLPSPAPQGPKTPDYARGTVTSRQRSRLDLQCKDETLAVTYGDDFPTGISEDYKQHQKKPRAAEKADTTKIVFPVKDGWKSFMSEEEREANRSELTRLQAKTSYLQNPRHAPLSSAHAAKSLVKQCTNKLKDATSPVKDKNKFSEDDPVFLAIPPKVEFTNCRDDKVYEIVLELKNVTSTMRQCRVLPPNCNKFSVGLGQFPGENGLVAPGMSCKYIIRFAPDSLRDYKDYIVVETQGAKSFRVPILSKRPPPVLTIPKFIDLGSCLVGGFIAAQLIVKNEGGPGKFCLMTRNKWPTTNIRHIIPNINKVSIKAFPFEVHPATFELASNESTIIEVVFNPLAERVFEQEMTVACDNCHASHFTLKGTGEIAAVHLKNVDFGLSEPMLGEFNDIMSKNIIRFDDLNAFTYTEKTVEITNKTNVELPFAWAVYKPVMPSGTMPCQDPVERQEERVADFESVFSVFPNSGVLQPAETSHFMMTFAPPREGDFHSVVSMRLLQIPIHMKDTDSYTHTRPYTQENATHDEDVITRMTSTAALISGDVSGIDFEVKGSCMPLNVVLHPYGLFLKDHILIGSSVKRIFTIANHSFSTITFDWKSYTSSYFLEVEPPYGELDPGMAMDLELSITSAEPVSISHNLLCYVLNMVEPLHFHVEANFIGPELDVSQPSINFGLVRVGQTETREMMIINKSPINVNFTIAGYNLHPEEETISEKSLVLSETEGTLKPMERRRIILTFSPLEPHTIKRTCEISYDYGKKISVGVYGEAQSPVVCFLESSKVLQEVYLGVPALFDVTIHNQTLLPTTYKFGKLQADEADNYEVSIEENEGEIKSWEQKNVTISFTSKKAGWIDNIYLPCCIYGGKTPIVLQISCDVKPLSVEYKLPTDKEPLCLDFGEEVAIGECAKQYFHICNKTAIEVPFSICAETFKAIQPTPPEGAQINPAPNRSKRKCILKKTTNIPDPSSQDLQKLKKDCQKSLLANSKGVVFVIQPSRGTLKAFEDLKVEVTANSNMWGTYKDNIISNVGDLEEKVIPVSVNIFGCPLSFQVTGGRPELKPMIRFGTYVPGGPVVKRRLKINNSCPEDIRLDWQTFDKEEDCSKLIDFIPCYGRPFPPEETEAVSPQAQASRLTTEDSYMSLWNSIDSSDFIPSSATEDIVNGEPLKDCSKLITCFLRPHEGNSTDEPFTVYPNQLTIKGNSSQTVDLTFKPLSTDDVTEEKDFYGFALAYMSLDSNNDLPNISRAEAYGAANLRVDFGAHMKPALFTIEELHDDGLVFLCAMSDITDKPHFEKNLTVRQVKLTNDTLTPLTFLLRVTEPYLLTNLQNLTGADDLTDGALSTHYCTLNPRHSIVVSVAFKVSRRLLASKYLPNIIDRSPDDKRLCFENDLIIHFNNKVEQTVPLKALVAVPQMELSTSFYDFGTCLVGQTRVMEFTISNKTYSHSKWAIEIGEKSMNCSDDTFLTNKSSGMLEAHIAHVSDSKDIVSVFFKAEHSEAYECLIIVKGLLGEKTRTIQVKGSGSYDGKHEAVLNI